uniref:Uncharacterized protein n=1 Tax=Chromera velia CCMP2878 TaxID=1169474 RepID=A0A0G4EZP8_9ALVE|eukprot:Cvel_2597.t1-p1 / transcript=Cvel_2597.t1 / gene=Cvel_2597 / organism=Chromera_velia_CCMP2878 / gene_product=hypothetical protein / transcript_product=hypothetical protein / location=Cvel_scaffold102:127316-127798(+) / protein_length=161 / sequence_SO=supercontig / SO=protein_coding / is_pseudo=false
MKEANANFAQVTDGLGACAVWTPQEELGKMIALPLLTKTRKGKDLNHHSRGTALESLFDAAFSTRFPGIVKAAFEDTAGSLGSSSGQLSQRMRQIAQLFDVATDVISGDPHSRTSDTLEALLQSRLDYTLTSCNHQKEPCSHINQDHAGAPLRWGYAHSLP